MLDSQGGKKRADAITPLLIQQAREGAGHARDQVLKSCWNYLLLIANQRLSSPLRAKMGGSDVAQMTLVQAAQKFSTFAGATDRELRLWLRGMLLNNLRHVTRQYMATQQRQASREVSLDGMLSPDDPAPQLISTGRSPGSEVVVSEERALVLNAIEQMPDMYRQVVKLRHWERLTFAQIAAQLDCSPEAARKTWYRAIARLKPILAKQLSSRKDP